MQDGCYSRDVYREKVTYLCQMLALLLYPAAELVQGQEVVRFIPGWFEARCIS